MENLLQLFYVFCASFFFAHYLVSGKPKQDATKPPDHRLHPNNNPNTYLGEHDGFAGPFGIFQIARWIVFVWLERQPIPDVVKVHIQDGFECRYCMTSTGAIILWFVPDVILMPFAAAGFATFIYCVITQVWRVGANDF